MWSELISEVTKVAPTLATILGGPYAGVGATLISSVFGGSPADPKELLDKIVADKQSDDKLKELEIQNKTALEQLAIQKEQMEYTDRQSARSASGISNSARVAIFFSIIVAMVITLIAIYEVSDTEIDKLLILLVGVFAREMVAMMRFWWGGQ